MVNLGMYWESLEDPRALMKTGLGLVLVGHVNFVLAALLLGAVLRHVSLHEQARAMQNAVTSVLVLSAGLLAVVAGILAIVMSKNKRNRIGMIFLLLFSFLAALLATASVVGLVVSMVMAIVKGRESLLTHCSSLDTISYYSITNECPFDPTRIFSTTLALWVLLLLMCVVEVAFSCRGSAASVCFLLLSPSYGPARGTENRRLHVSLSEEMSSLSHVKPQREKGEPHERQDLLNRNVDTTSM